MFDLIRRFFSTPPRPVPDDLWQATLDTCPLTAPLTPAERDRLRALCAQFLAQKRFSPVQGMVLDDARCLVIAAQACLPVLDLGFDWLRGWREVIVYPGEFRVRREHHDEPTGVVTEGDDVLIGEAWERGPLILSWADIEQDLDDPHSGYNVVAHEIAHKLDMLDGAADGVPPLPAGMDRRAWIAAFQAAYDAHARAVDNGVETVLDPYAAESPDEFFAVVCETWFSAPEQIDREAPALAPLLRRFFQGGRPVPA